LKNLVKNVSFILLKNITNIFIIYWKNIIIISVEKRKEAHGDSVDKQQKKKIERVEEKLKINNRDLSMVKMKSMFAIGFAFTALLSMFNSMWVLFVNFLNNIINI